MEFNKRVSVKKYLQKNKTKVILWTKKVIRYRKCLTQNYNIYW